MQQENAVEFGGCLIQPIVTESESGRFAAAATVLGWVGEERMIGVDGDFGQPQEAIDQAIELAIAWTHRRRVVSDHYVRAG
ncbi:hypothetical protein [Caballeronia mineralivorans]|jgi:hypothetical protein|uniref:hypothetical protein n=1 Tax=Caballeronia mineralivorans TaxID=2010198 RepID=UPI0023F3A494|nr:hypothetical protein [Caballeronia mineralivorans]MDB5784156.1 hypothetical protein [Caballeronia mineralivorans]